MKVTVFKTTDGKLIEDESEYINYEHQIELRNFITNTLKMNVAQSLTPSQIASFLTAHADEVNNISQKYKRKINGYNKRHNVAVSIEVAV